MVLNRFCWLPIAFGMLLSNLPVSGMFIEHFEITSSNQLTDAGILTVFYALKPILPSLIFLGVGSMTDFGPLIANPKSLLMGAAAQLGIFFAFFAAIILGFNAQEAASIGIIGGADGPTAIYLTGKLADHLLGPIAVAAYSYMALVPVIQPPIMRALTTKKEREIKMEQLRVVSQREKILFPIAVTVVVVLLLPSGSASRRYAHAGQSVQGMRKNCKTFGGCRKCADEYPRYRAGSVCRSIRYRRNLHYSIDSEDRGAGRMRIRSRSAGRCDYAR